jgi:subtilisin family serine protease
MHTLAALVGAAAVIVSTPGSDVPADPFSNLVSPVPNTQRGVIRNDLAAVMRGARADELIEITIVLRDRVDRARLDDLAAVDDKERRRTAVIAELRRHAAATNGALVRALEEQQARGQVGPVKALWITNAVLTSATPGMIERIAQRPEVASIYQPKRIGAEVFPVEPQVVPDREGGADGGTIECGVAEMRAPEVWETYGLTGDGVVVGIIDTGACITHPDLANQIWSNPGEIPGNGIDDDENGHIDDVVGWNFRDDTADVSDTNGHGTHTGGTVAGDGTNGEQTGMAPDADLMVLKMWNSFSGEQVVWQCMEYAVENGAHVITASIGWPHSVGPERDTWREVCEAAIAAGVVVIYASGNEGGCCPPENVRTPGDVPDVITIGATDCNQSIASFSSRGPVSWTGILPWDDWPFPPGKIKPTVSAPGVDTLSTSNNCSGYRTLSGTSMATPHVAGAVALMLQANPGLDHFGVKQILMETAIDRGAAGMDNDYGAGFVDALAAVEAALETTIEGDVNDDGVVDAEDLLAVLAAWGPCGECPEDINGDGTVDTEDLTILLANWS